MHRSKREHALLAARIRTPPSLLVGARPLTAFRANPGFSLFSDRLPASLSCLRGTSRRSEPRLSPPLWPASQTTRAACLLVVSLTSGQRFPCSGFPLEDSRFPPIQSRPRGFPRVSVRAPTFGVPKCRSRGSLGLVSLHRLHDSWVCRPLCAQSCSLCPVPTKASCEALSMCQDRHADGQGPSGHCSLLSAVGRPARGRSAPDWIRTPSLSGWGALPPSANRLTLTGGTLPCPGGAHSPEGVRSPDGEVGQISMLSTRVLAEPGARGQLLGMSPARVRTWSVVEAAVSTSGPSTTVALCGVLTGGLFGSPQLGFHVCHLCRSDPATLRSSKLARRSRRGRTSSK